MQTSLESQYDVRMSGTFLLIYICNFHVLNHFLLVLHMPTPGMRSGTLVFLDAMSGLDIILQVCFFHM